MSRAAVRLCRHAEQVSAAPRSTAWNHSSERWRGASVVSRHAWKRAADRWARPDASRRTTRRCAKRCSSPPRRSSVAGRTRSLDRADPASGAGEPAVDRGRAVAARSVTWHEQGPSRWSSTRPRRCWPWTANGPAMATLDPPPAAAARRQTRLLERFGSSSLACAMSAARALTDACVLGDLRATASRATSCSRFPSPAGRPPATQNQPPVGAGLVVAGDLPAVAGVRRVAADTCRAAPSGAGRDGANARSTRSPAGLPGSAGGAGCRSGGHRILAAGKWPSVFSSANHDWSKFEEHR